MFKSPNGATRSSRSSQLVIFFPFGTRLVTRQQAVGNFMISNAATFGIETELGIGPLGDDAKRHGLAERSRDPKIRVRPFLAHDCAQEVARVACVIRRCGRDFAL